MGGECNYLLRVAGPDKRLQFVPDSEWKSPFMQVGGCRGTCGWLRGTRLRLPACAAALDLQRHCRGL